METQNKEKPKEKIQHLINIHTLIHTYKIFLNNPNEIFLKKDFIGWYKTIKTHLFVLEKLGLIESGRKQYIRNGKIIHKTTTTYKLKQPLNYNQEHKTRVIKVYAGEKE